MEAELFHRDGQTAMRMLMVAIMYVCVCVCIYIYTHTHTNLLEEQANKLISTLEYIHMVTNRIHPNVLNIVDIKISCNGGRNAQLGQNTLKHNQLLIQQGCVIFGKVKYPGAMRSIRFTV